MNLIYDSDFVKKMAILILVPVVCVVAFTVFCLFIYSLTNKEHNSPRYNYIMNFYSCLIGVVLVSLLLAVSIGFSYNFIEFMKINQLNGEFKNVYYIVYALPFLPLITLFIILVKFIKVVMNRPEKEEINNNEILNKPKEEDIEVF